MALPKIIQYNIVKSYSLCNITQKIYHDVLLLLSIDVNGLLLRIK